MLRNMTSNSNISSRFKLHLLSFYVSSASGIAIQSDRICMKFHTDISVCNALCQTFALISIFLWLASQLLCYYLLLSKVLFEDNALGFSVTFPLFCPLSQYGDFFLLVYPDFSSNVSVAFIRAPSFVAHYFRIVCSFCWPNRSSNFHKF